MTTDNKVNDTTRRAVIAAANEDARQIGEVWHKLSCPCIPCVMERKDHADRIAAFHREQDVLGDYISRQSLGAFTRPVTAAPTSKQPAILTRDDGETLIYAGKVSSLYGEPASGKSWLGLMIAIESIRKGGRVIWWDSEDRPQTIYQRAKVLGGLPEVTSESFLWVEPSLCDDSTALGEAIRWIGRGGPFSVVVVDAVESHGCPSDGSPINEWWESHVNPWRSTDCAIVLLDHIPKRRQDRPKGGIGSVHKLSRLDGAGLRVSGNPWTKKEPGALSLYPQKDRHGDLPGNPTTPAAVIIGDHWALPDGESAFKVSIEAPKKTGGDTLEIRVLEALGEHGQVTGQNELRAVVKGRKQDVLVAVENLVFKGMVAKESTGKAMQYTITAQGLEHLNDD